MYAAVSDLITGQEDLAALIDGVARDLATQNVRYAEVQVYPGALVGNGIPRAAVTEALDAGDAPHRRSTACGSPGSSTFPGSRPTGGPAGPRARP